MHAQKNSKLETQILSYRGIVNLIPTIAGKLKVFIIRATALIIIILLLLLANTTIYTIGVQVKNYDTD